MAPEKILRVLFQAALEAAAPSHVVAPHLPPPPRGRTAVLGAGKAAAAMAQAVEAHWSAPLSGLVVTRYGHGVPCERIEVVEAAHPVPDDSGRKAARRILEEASALGAGDLALCLLSGGASALLALPAPGLTLEDKQATSRALLRSGATITEMNCVRKHLSAVKGGRLAAACAPAAVHTLAISDVPGDDPSTIGSGPTVADATTFADARAVIRRYEIRAPKSVRDFLERAEGETPKPGDPRLAGVCTTIVAGAHDALAAAAHRAQRLGLHPVLLGDSIEGEAREVARDHAAAARRVARQGRPASEPTVLLSGGETTVAVHGPGRGGRNTEFLLALALALDGHPRVHALAADTDGIDGTESNAGAVVGPDTLARAAAAGLDAEAFLERNDAFSFFEALGDLVTTGPTRTNVNDFRAVLVC